MSRLTIQLIVAEPEFAALGNQWQALAEQDDQATIFNDWQWNSLWWQHYNHLGELYVLLVHSDDKLVGIAPFYRNNSTALRLFKQNTLRFIGVGGDTSPDDVNIIAAPSYRQLVVDMVWAHLLDAKFDRMIFVDIPEQSDFNQIGLERTLGASGYRSKLQEHTRRFAQLPQDWAGFRAQISRNTFKRIKRRQNRLDEHGNSRCHLCETEQELNAAFEALVELHGARWESKGEGGAFSTEAYLGFHRAFMQMLFSKQQLWLLTLNVNDQIIAVEYAFQHKDTLMFFQTGFNPEYEKLSPGHVLMTYAIRQAIESGIKKIDLLKGDYEYKTSYANQTVTSVSWTHYSSGLVGLLARLRDKLGS